MAACCQVYDSRHLQADCQELGHLRNPALGNRVWATLTFLRMLKKSLKTLKTWKHFKMFGNVITNIYHVSLTAAQFTAAVGL